MSADRSHGKSRESSSSNSFLGRDATEYPENNDHASGVDSYGIPHKFEELIEGFNPEETQINQEIHHFEGQEQRPARQYLDPDATVVAVTKESADYELLNQIMNYPGLNSPIATSPNDSPSKPYGEAHDTKRGKREIANSTSTADPDSELQEARRGKRIYTSPARESNEAKRYRAGKVSSANPDDHAGPAECSVSIKSSWTPSGKRPRGDFRAGQVRDIYAGDSQAIHVQITMEHVVYEKYKERLLANDKTLFEGLKFKTLLRNPGERTRTEDEDLVLFLAKGYEVSQSIILQNYRSTKKRVGVCEIVLIVPTASHFESDAGEMYEQGYDFAVKCFCEGQEKEFEKAEGKTEAINRTGEFRFLRPGETHGIETAVSHKNWLQALRETDYLHPDEFDDDTDVDNDSDDGKVINIHNVPDITGKYRSTGSEAAFDLKDSEPDEATPIKEVCERFEISVDRSKHLTRYKLKDGSRYLKVILRFKYVHDDQTYPEEPIHKLMNNIGFQTAFAEKGSGNHHISAMKSLDFSNSELIRPSSIHYEPIPEDGNKIQHCAFVNLRVPVANGTRNFDGSSKLAVKGWLLSGDQATHDQDENPGYPLRFGAYSWFGRIAARRSTWLPSDEQQ